MGRSFIGYLNCLCRFDVLRPAITTLLSHVNEAQQGLINGLNMSLTSIGNIVGPILGGALLAYRR